MFSVSLLFFLSGFSALVYELVWFRHLGLIFGNTVQAAATVITAYMCGLAVGAHVSGKFADRVARPMRCFGFLSLGIGAFSLHVPLLFAGLRHLYRFLSQGASETTPWLTVARFLLALIILIVPTLLMGATLPVLAKGLLRDYERFGTRLGTLYGVNTLGAVLGTGLCGFVLIPWWGVTRTNLAAVAVSLAVGVLAWILSRRADEARAEGTESAEALTRTQRRKVLLILAAAGASGCLALGFEVVWFRTLILVFGSTTYSFSAMLAVFLLGIALGSSLLGWVVDRSGRALWVFGGAATGVGVYTLASLYWFGAMPLFLLKQLVRWGFSWPTMMAAKVAITLAFLFVPTLLFGLAFTAAAKAVRETLSSSPRTVARIYAWNTVGSAAGSFLAGFVVLPLLGLLNSLALLALLALGLGVAASAGAPGAGWRRAPAAVLSAIAVAAFFAHPPRWEQQLLASGPYFSPWNYVRDGQITLYEQLRSQRQLFFREGVATTVSVVKSADEDLYYCATGKVEADSTPRSMMLQRMIGHLPMLFHPNPRRVLNIGLGAGVTFGALGCYPVDTAEVVEIEPAVRRVAEIWGERNHRILDNPRARVTINDGRNRLFCAREPYDVITSDPFEPVMAGAGNLYTVEHFRRARACLTPGGIMAQYLPLYELSKEDFLTILRSFVHVFPQTAVFFTGTDIVMLGFNGPLQLDAARLRDRFNLPAVHASLSEVGFVRPEMILGMFVADMGRAGAVIESGPLNTDDHPVIEFSAPKSALRFTPDTNQAALIESMTTFPDALLAGLSDAERTAALTQHEALQMAFRASILRTEGRMQETFDLLTKAAEKAPDNPVIRNELVAVIQTSAASMLAAGQIEQAFVQYQLAIEHQADDFWSLYNLVGLSMRLRKFDLARRYLGLGLQYYPESPLFVALRGRYRGTAGDVKGACDDIESALKALPNRAEFWDDYAFFLNAAGKTEAATTANARARGLRL